MICVARSDVLDRVDGRWNNYARAALGVGGASSHLGFCCCSYAERMDRSVPLPPVMPTVVRALPSWSMGRLSRIGRRWLESGLAVEDLRLAHYATLETLAERGELVQRDLAIGAGYDPSDMVAILDHLQSLGFLQRERDPQDRRRQIIRMTEDGHRAVRRGRQLAQEAAERMLAPLGDDAAKFVAMLHVLLQAHDM